MCFKLFHLKNNGQLQNNYEEDELLHDNVQLIPNNTLIAAQEVYKAGLTQGVIPKLHYNFI